MFQQSIEVCGRTISRDGPAFVIAEAACNHMCDVELAKRMIDEAQAAGADAVTFQTYKAERLVVKEAESYWKNTPTPGAVSQFEYYKKLDRFGEDEYRELFAYAREREIIAFSTPFDTTSADMLAELGAPMFKIASCDLPDLRLLRHVASLGKPVILSTGGSELTEVERAVDALGAAGCTELVLLACTLSYPTANADANLRRIPAFSARFPELIIGLSDHTEPDPHMVIPSLGVALGATVIEKHYTLDRSMTGSGHSFSVTPADLAMMIQNIRVCEEVLGSSEICVHEAEQPAREKARRSLVADRPIKRGEVISTEMIGIKRPGDGLSPARIDEVLGLVARVDLDADASIQLEDLEPAESYEAS
jgi:sialic acid synthase SpsE